MRMFELLAMGGTPPGTEADPRAQTIQMVGMFAILGVMFYFLLIRPQQKKVKDHQAMLGQLKKNDEVMTSGGIYGKVVALADTVVTLEVAPNVRIRVNRPQISEIVKADKSVIKES